MHDDRRLLSMLLPFFVAGVLVHLWKPLHVFPAWWIGIAVGVVLVASAITVAGTVPHSRTGPATRLQTAAGAGYLGASCLANSVWPIAMLIPALILIIKWRAVSVQTGRRPPA